MGSKKTSQRKARSRMNNVCHDKRVKLIKAVRNQSLLIHAQLKGTIFFRHGSYLGVERSLIALHDWMIHDIINGIIEWT